MNSEKPLVFVLILMKDNWKDTVECLQSLQNLDYANCNIVLIDNGSEDFHFEKILEWCRGEIKLETNFVKFRQENFPVSLIIYSKEEAEKGGSGLKENETKDLPFNRKLVLIRIPENLGFAGGNNTGIKYALKKGADFVLLLNNDAVVNPKLVNEMLKTTEANRKIGVVGAKIYYYQKPYLIQEAGGAKFYPFSGVVRPIGRKKIDRGQYEEDFEVDYASGCCSLIRKELIEEIGFLDEDFFHYWEETDLNLRARKKGWKIICSTKAKVWHKLSSTSGYKSPFSDYYFTRNSLMLIKKHYPFYLPIVFLFNFYKFPIRIVKGKWKNIIAVAMGIMDFLKGKKGKTFKN